MKQRFILLCVIVLQTLVCYSKMPPVSRARAAIVIAPVFNGAPLVLNDQYYVDEHGDTLYIDLFRFYITDLKLSSGNIVAIDTNSHLIDAEDTATTTFHVDNIAAGSYTSLQFVVGVDSIANVSGANGGDLDPSKGMYWAWNSGYIMAKLEGHAKVCKTLHRAFEFHIGGYMTPYNAARVVRVQFPHAVTILNGSNTIIKIKADVAAWFRGNLDLSKLNSVVIPGKEANNIADNYAHMFSAE